MDRSDLRTNTRQIPPRWPVCYLHVDVRHQLLLYAGIDIKIAVLSPQLIDVASFFANTLDVNGRKMTCHVTPPCSESDIHMYTPFWLQEISSAM